MQIPTYLPRRGTTCPASGARLKLCKQYLALCEFKSFVKLVARRFSSIDFSLEHRSRKYTCTYVGTEYQKLLRENENADHVRKTIVYRSTVIYFADVFAFYSCRCGSRTSSSSGREKVVDDR